MGVTVDREQASGLESATGKVSAQVQPFGTRVDLQGGAIRGGRREDAVPVEIAALPSLDEAAARVGDDVYAGVVNHGEEALGQHIPCLPKS